MKTGSKDPHMNRARRRVTLGFAGVTMLAATMMAGAARADSWMLPEQEEFLSADKRTRLTITPRQLAGQLEYFQDKVDGKTAAGQRPGSIATTANGKLENKTPDGWQVVWQRALVNDVSPTRALVADRGKYTVTFDNWHSVGFGNDVVVIYDAAAKLVRSMALKDFLPQDYVLALPRSVSSIHWGYGHHLADRDETLVLQVVMPDEEGPERSDEKSTFIDVRVRLADGAVTPPTGPAWERALAKAALVRAAQQAEEQAFRARRAATITAPASDDQDAWKEYLTEMMVRSVSDVIDFPRLFFLPAESDAGYSEGRAMILDLISDGFDERFNPGTKIVFASPSSARLSELMVAGLGDLPKDALHGYTILFAGEQAFDATVGAAVQRTGAQYAFIDVRKPIAGQELPARGSADD